MNVTSLNEVAIATPDRDKFTVSACPPTSPEKAVLLIKSPSVPYRSWWDYRKISKPRTLFLVDQEPMTWPIAKSTPKKQA